MTLIKRTLRKRIMVSPDGLVTGGIICPVMKPRKWSNPLFPDPEYVSSDRFRVLRPDSLHT